MNIKVGKSFDGWKKLADNLPTKKKHPVSFSLFTVLSFSANGALVLILNCKYPPLLC